MNCSTCKLLGAAEVPPATHRASYADGTVHIICAGCARMYRRVIEIAALLPATNANAVPMTVEEL